MKDTFKVLGTKIAIKIIETGQFTESGLALSTTAKATEKANVVYVGEDVSKVKVGDIVIYNPNKLIMSTKVNSDTLWLIDIEDILAVI